MIKILSSMGIRSDKRIRVVLLLCWAVVAFGSHAQADPCVWIFYRSTNKLVDEIKDSATEVNSRREIFRPLLASGFLDVAIAEALMHDLGWDGRNPPNEQFYRLVDTRYPDLMVKTIDAVGVRLERLLWKDGRNQLRTDLGAVFGAGSVGTEVQGLQRSTTDYRTFSEAWAEVIRVCRPEILLFIDQEFRHGASQFFARYQEFAKERHFKIGKITSYSQPAQNEEDRLIANLFPHFEAGSIVNPFGYYALDSIRRSFEEKLGNSLISRLERERLLRKLVNHLIPYSKANTGVLKPLVIEYAESSAYTVFEYIARIQEDYSTELLQKGLNSESPPVFRATVQAILDNPENISEQIKSSLYLRWDKNIHRKPGADISNTTLYQAFLLLGQPGVSDSSWSNEPYPQSVSTEIRVRAVEDAADWATGQAFRVIHASLLDPQIEVQKAALRAMMAWVKQVRDSGHTLEILGRDGRSLLTERANQWDQLNIQDRTAQTQFYIVLHELHFPDHQLMKNKLIGVARSDLPEDRATGGPRDLARQYLKSHKIGY